MSQSQSATSMTGKTILLVDDHETVRMGVGAALRHHWESDSRGGPEIVEADSVSSALQQLSETVIDVAIVDLRLGDGSGLQIAQAVSDNRLDTRCVVLTSLKSPRALIKCFETGAVAAFIEKADGIKNLIEAVEVAANGYSMLDARDVAAARQQLIDQGGLDRSLLTEKENRFADLVADGFSDQEIADQMFVAATTVRNVLSRIYKKLDIEGRNRLSAMVWQDRPDGSALD